MLPAIFKMELFQKSVLITIALVYDDLLLTATI